MVLFECVILFSLWVRTNHFKAGKRDTSGIEILTTFIVIKEVHVNHIPVRVAFSPDCHKNK